MKEQDFYFEKFEKEAIKQIKSGKKLEGKDGVLAPLLQRLFIFIRWDLGQGRKYYYFLG